jgi:Fe2+ or Zn2+ uptake regulation protein
MNSDSRASLFSEKESVDPAARIRAAGARVTPARMMVLETIIRSNGHLSAEEIFSAVGAINSEIHLSTIYRALETLEEIRIVEHVHLGHGKAIYHLSENLHQHLVCESCGSTLEAPPDLSARLELELSARLGFHIRAYHFSILGICQKCWNENNSTEKSKQPQEEETL